MLRGVRFATTFDFALEESTLAAIKDLGPTVTAVSAERIAQEMRALLVLPARSRGVDLLHETGLLAVLLPELVPLVETPVVPDLPELGTLWQRTIGVLERLVDPSFPLALAALLHAARWHEHEPPHGAGERAAAELLRRVADRWRLSNKDTDHAAWLVEHHRALVASYTMPWPKLQRLLISEEIDDLLNLHEAIALTAGCNDSHVDFCRGRLRLPAGELDPPPLLTGDDLIRHGVARGKIYKTLLEEVRDAQLDKRIANRDDALALVDRFLQKPLTYRATNEQGTEKLGIALAAALPRPAVVAVRGTLGAGKTRLVRAMAQGLGIAADLVTSPTFVLVREYPGETPLYHFDAYRLHSDEEFWQLGPEEYFDGEMGGITVVEWADRVERCLPPERLEVAIEVTGATERTFVVTALGERYQAALNQLKKLLGVG
jgi:tRNA threonylcarbamoyl adenosine modification protein YjeE